MKANEFPIYNATWSSAARCWKFSSQDAKIAWEDCIHRAMKYYYHTCYVDY